MNYGRGFTIVEIIVAIAVIGVLSTLGFVAWRTTKNTAIDNQTKASVAILKQAIERYYDDHGEYPRPSINCIQQEVYWSRCINGELASVLVPKYLPSIPNGPTEQPFEYIVDISRLSPGKATPDRYGILVRLSTGNCKAGKRLHSNWWGTTTPACDF